MTESNRRRDHQPLGLLGRVAVEVLHRQASPSAVLEALAEDPESFDQPSEATRIAAVAAAVWHRHEARPRARDARLEPKLRSLKGQQPEMEDYRVRGAILRLRAVPLSKRSRFVRLKHYEYRGSVIALAFIDEARRALPSSPEVSKAWARLVDQAVGLDFHHYCADRVEQMTLCLRASLYRANAERCGGQLDRAETSFALAEREARYLEITDPEFWSEYASFRASLYRDRRDFRRALRDAYLAAAILSLGENSPGEARVLWKVASIHEQLGQPRAALTSVRQAKALLEGSNEAELLFGLGHAEVSHLVRCGEVLEAYVAYRTLEAEYSLRPDYEPFRLWVVGLISQARGQAQEAENAFREARAILVEQGNAYDAALVTLDWSLFLLEQNRPDDVLPLAVSMGQAFEALGVARETMASWAIFQAAAERRELTRAVAETVVRALGEERVAARVMQ